MDLFTYKNYCKQDACDKTKLQRGSKAGSWPLMLTVSILNDQQIYNLPIMCKSLLLLMVDLSRLQLQADGKR
jgi:hypothetical protein